MSQQVAVLDYGMGNLHSVSKALERMAPVGTRVRITADPAHLRAADRVVVPGVGAIRDCMAELTRLGFHELIPELVATGRPVLGICIGMQILLERSEENGGVDGLGLFTGQVCRFPDPVPGATALKVPHMGWNQVWQQCPHPLWQGIADGERFYFVHSYYATGAHAENVAGSCDYGLRFVAALHRDNLFAVQFHPEKSQRAGLSLLGNFLSWQP